MRAATFDVRVGNVGPERVMVNEHDVTDLVTGVSILSQDGAPPLVRLGLKPGIAVSEIAGDGIVEVQPAAEGADVAGWLANIDAGELERVVLERSSMATMADAGGSPVAIALGVLREMAAGKD